MGNVQRIIYYHVPSAWTAFLLFFINFVCSIQYLVRSNPVADKVTNWTVIAIAIAACVAAFVIHPLAGGRGAVVGGDYGACHRGPVFSDQEVFLAANGRTPWQWSAPKSASFSAPWFW